MTDRERLLRRLSAYDFASQDLHIYLDTHPDDASAADALDLYEKKSRKLREEYEEKYAPLSPSDQNGNRWAWISDPWPWDNEEG